MLHWFFCSITLVHRILIRHSFSVWTEKECVHRWMVGLLFYAPQEGENWTDLMNVWTSWWVGGCVLGGWSHRLFYSLKYVHFRLVISLFSVAFTSGSFTSSYQCVAFSCDISGTRRVSAIWPLTHSPADAWTSLILQILCRHSKSVQIRSAVTVFNDRMALFIHTGQFVVTRV